MRFWSCWCITSLTGYSPEVAVHCLDAVHDAMSESAHKPLLWTGTCMATNEVVADQLSDYRSSLARARAFLRAANGAIDTADRVTAIETLAPEVKRAKTVAGRRRVVSAMKARLVEI